MKKQWISKKNILLWNYNDLLNNVVNIGTLIFITNNICQSFYKLLNKYINVGKHQLIYFLLTLLLLLDYTRIK